MLATHYQDSTRSGGVFKNATSVIAEESAATAISTMFAPAAMLEEMAQYFPVRGDRVDEVATLLVEDTWQ